MLIDAVRDTVQAIRRDPSKIAIVFNRTGYANFAQWRACRKTRRKDRLIRRRLVDCVYCYSLNHIFDVSWFVSEIRRVLKPGGIFLADVMYG